MKKPISKREDALAQRVRELTGKKLSTCVFCVRYKRGNYKEALRMCSQSADAEGERCGYYQLAIAA